MLPRVRTNSLTGYAVLARSAGLDPAALTARVGLDITDLDVPDRWIPAAPAVRLLELSAQQADCPDFGLRLANFRTLGTLGPLSVVLREEPDLRSVVDLLIRYERAYSEPVRMRLRNDDGRATIEVWMELGEPAPTEQALDLIMAAFVGVARALVRPDWKPLAACFARPPPPDAGPWERLFGSVAFGQNFTGLVIHPSDLDAAITTSDPSLRPYTREFLHSLPPPREPSTAPSLADVVETLELLLPLGRHSMDEVGRHIGLGPRALQRYLADSQETFSSVVHATRAHLAERYLAHEQYSLTEVSQQLGFSAPSSFTRWFRQQFGTSPTEWRSRARASSRTIPVPRADGQESTGSDRTVPGG